jgi:hypothetical protein
MKSVDIVNNLMMANPYAHREQWNNGKAEHGPNLSDSIIPTFQHSNFPMPEQSGPG